VTYVVESVANYHCVVGENPLWNERDGRLYWEDINSGKLFRVDHATLVHECFYTGEVIGGFTFQEDGSLLLFEEDRIARLDTNGQREVLREGVDPDMKRWNDVIADPEGRVFAGTIGQTLGSGGLYRVERNGTIENVVKGSGVANGLGFSPDLSLLYWTCSTRRTIFVFDYWRATGELTNQRVFYQAPEGEGTLDGLTVDTEGNVWTARWDGHALLKLSPRAELLETIRFPVPKVSCPAFGGPDLDTLYVTTASIREPSDGADGSLYRVKVAARGRPEFRSRFAL
jgi:D-xylono/L-arabinono-1,4-lactonase